MEKQGENENLKLSTLLSLLFNVFLLNHLTMMQNKGVISKTQRRSYRAQRIYLHKFVFLGNRHIGADKTESAVELCEAIYRRLVRFTKS